MADAFNMSDVFISYAREDKSFVQQLDAALRGKGRQCWVDWEDIPLSADWLQEVKAGIESAETFIFIISPDSLRSGPCSQEVIHAVEHGKRIVPILRRSPEDQDMQRMHPKLSAHNWVFFDKDEQFEKGFEDLNTALDTDLAHVRQHTRLLVRAREWEDAGSNPSLLLRGDDLRAAEDWLILSDLEKKEPAPSERQRQYIINSRRAANAARRTTIAASLIVLGFALLALIALIGFTRAEEQRQIAEANQRAAESARQIAVAERDQSTENATRARSLSLASSSLVAYTEGNTDQALTLALIAGEEMYIPQIELALAKAAYAPGARLIISAADGRFEDVPGTLAISPDGTEFASGHNDGLIFIWDAVTGEELIAIEADDSGGLVYDTVYTADGAQLFSTGVDGIVHLWDVESGAEIRRYEYEYELYALALSPDEQTIIAGGSNNELIAWDVASGLEIKRWPAHESWINDIQYRPDGAQMATAGNDAAILLWNTADWSQTGALEGHSGQVRSLAYSSDGGTLISGSDDFNVLQWDTSTGQLIRTFGEGRIGHTDWVTSVAYEPGGSRVISGAEDNSLIVWNGETGELLQRFTDHRAQIFAVAFSPDRRTALSASGDFSIRLWDLQSGAEVAQLPFEGLNQDINSTAFIEGGTQFIAVQDNGTIGWWDTATQEEFESFPVGDETAIYSVVVAPNEQIAASVVDDESVIDIWDMETAEVIYRMPLRDENVYFHSAALAFSPDSTLLLAGASDGAIYLFDVENGELLNLMQGHSEIVNSVAFSPDGTKALSAGADWLINQWDIESGQLIRQIMQHNDSVQTAIYNTDGSQILSAGWDNTIARLDAATGSALHVYEGHTGAVLRAVFLRDDAAIMSTSSDGTIRIWDTASGVELRRYDSHTSGVDGLAINPDETLALSASADGTLRLWHIHTFDELLDWTLTNRQPLNLTCSERILYSVRPLCDEATLSVAVDVAIVQATAQASTSVISEVYRGEVYPIIGETLTGETVWYQIEMPTGQRGWLMENEVVVEQPE